MVASGLVFQYCRSRPRVRTDITRTHHRPALCLLRRFRTVGSPGGSPPTKAIDMLGLAAGRLPRHAQVPLAHESR